MKFEKVKKSIDYALIIVLLVNILVNICKMIDTRNTVHRNTAILEELKEISNSLNNVLGN